MLNQVKHAIRSLCKEPAFALTAIITISLGIGASSAIFSVANAVLLRPLPYKDPGRLVVATGELRKRGVFGLPLSDPDFIDLRTGAKAEFDDVAAVMTGRMLLPKTDGTLEQVHIASVTPNFFRLMGGRIMIGRDFVKADAQTESRGHPLVAIASYEYWQRRYGGDKSMFQQGKAIEGVRTPEIVGVLNPGFELLLPPSLNVERVCDLWIATRVTYDNTQRKTFMRRVIGRLKQGVSLKRAQAKVENISAGLRRTFPLWQTGDFHIRLESMRKYLVAQVQPALVLLLGAALFLLLIACANVANLLLARLSMRERQLAICSALGGSRLRLIWQTLVDVLVLSAAGTLLGIGLAWLGVQAAIVIAPPDLPRLDSITISPVVLTFAALLGIAAGATFGIAPALRSSQPDVMNILRGSGRNANLGASRTLRNSAVIAEIALSFALLIGSGLMLRSFAALQAINPGFDPQGLLTFELIGRPSAVPQQREALTREIRDLLTNIPGIISVTAASPFPLAQPFDPIRWGTEQALVDASKFQAADYQVVLPGYFETMRTPLIAGRTFTADDNAPEDKRVIVDQLLASKAFPDESAVGKRILIRIRTPEPEWVDIIGVVAHQHSSSLVETGREQIYFTDGFLGFGAATRWAVRTKGNPAQYERAVRQKAAQLNRQLVISEMHPMDVYMSRAQAATRFSFLLITVYSSIALVLAAGGIYSVLATVARQRRTEIGVRMALGATSRNIFGLVIRQGLILSTVGIIIGLVGALCLTHVIAGMLVGIKATDPLTFVSTILLFLLVALLASWLPAQYAAASDPATTLREGQ